MASYTAAVAKSITTAVGTGDDCQFSGNGRVIQVVHRGTVDPIWFTLGPTLATTPAPTVAGDNVFVAMPGVTTPVPWPGNAVGRVNVRTVCATAQACTIQILTR